MVDNVVEFPKSVSEIAEEPHPSCGACRNHEYTLQLEHDVAELRDALASMALLLVGQQSRVC